MPLKYKILIWIGVIFGVLSFVRPQLQSALAAITNSSRVIPYQGRLTDSGGNNVADSTYAMTFKIYTVSSGGSSSFTEVHSSVTVSSGLFSVLLGSLSASGVNLDFANPPYYLGITIGNNSEMSPRIQLGFVPLAHNAQYLDGNPASAFGVPSGIIAYSATTCPTGWSEYTTARGMYIVGNPSGGTLATAVGTALTNLENRAVGQHLHSVNPPSTSTDTTGSHQHGRNTDNDAGGNLGIGWTGGDAGYGYTYTDAAGSHSHTVDIAAFDSTNAGSVAGTNAPYIQLTACKKD